MTDGQLDKWLLAGVALVGYVVGAVMGVNQMPSDREIAACRVAISTAKTARDTALAATLPHCAYQVDDAQGEHRKKVER